MGSSPFVGARIESLRLISFQVLFNLDALLFEEEGCYEEENNKGYLLEFDPKLGCVNLVLSDLEAHEVLVFKDMPMFLHQLHFKNVVKEVIEISQSPQSCHVDKLVDGSLLRLEHSEAHHAYQC